MNYELGITVGNILIPYYGLFIVIGILSASLIGWYQVRRYKMDINDFIIMAAFMGQCAILGAKLLYIIVSIEQIDFTRLGEPAYLNTIMSGGFVFYGGLLGGIAGLFLCKKLFKIPVFQYAGIAIPCIPIAHGFGRIGCSLVGCCYGCPYEGIGAIHYSNSLFAPNDISLFPIQGAEAVLNFIIAAILIVYINRFHGKYGAELYLVMYACVRFVLEFFRFDDQERGMLFQLSTSQYISIVLVLVLGTVIFRRSKYRS